MRTANPSFLMRGSIRLERKQMQDIRASADKVIDTTGLEIRETDTFENGGSAPKIILKNAQDSVGSDFILIAVTPASPSLAHGWRLRCFMVLRCLTHEALPHSRVITRGRLTSLPSFDGSAVTLYGAS
jgi:hypothetical protein